MGYWPHKGSFFFFDKGYIYLFQDVDADTQDYCECPDATSSNDDCVNTENLCDTSKAKDPCAIATPLFASGTTPLIHKLQVDTSTNGGWNVNHVLTFEIVFDSIFVVFT